MFVLLDTMPRSEQTLDQQFLAAKEVSFFPLAPLYIIIPGSLDSL